MMEKEWKKIEEMLFIWQRRKDIKYIYVSTKVKDKMMAIRKKQR
jgi:hypothetical protein